MRTPVLIIGSGLAGLSTAYRFAQLGIDCTVVTKDGSLIHGTNSELAQGGIIYRPQGDSPDALVSDVLNAGDQINFEPAVRRLATDGIRLVKEILIDGAKVPFDVQETLKNIFSRVNGDKLAQSAAADRLPYGRRSASPKNSRKDVFQSFPHFTKEAAHDRARIIHVKDQTGKSIMEHLLATVRSNQHVRFLTNHILVDLLTSGHNCKGYEMKYHRNRCLGAYLFDVRTKKVRKVLADFTVLATGGVGQVYQYHTNAEHAYGSGLAAANRARVRIINARFVQFHPTALWTPAEPLKNIPFSTRSAGHRQPRLVLARSPRQRLGTRPLAADDLERNIFQRSRRQFLISEALRGEGARLMNNRGTLFMEKYPLKDLETRAVVARAVMEEMKKSRSDHVFLNLADFYQGSVSISERFPGIYAECMKQGIDISREPIPVVPAAHFFCGGIAVDLNGESELPGLFAAGEVACTGVHGSNRLASTSLLEALTWGVAAADEIHRQMPAAAADPVLKKSFSLVENWQSFGKKHAAPKSIEREKGEIRRIMWERVGILRTKNGLLEAKDKLRILWNSIEKKYSESALSEDLIELRHMAETAWIITNSASSHTSLMKDNLGGHRLVK